MYRIKKGSYEPGKQDQAEELAVGTIEQRISQIQTYFSNTEDLIVQKFDNQICSIVYVESLVKHESLQAYFMTPMLESGDRALEQLVRSTTAKLTNIYQIGKCMLEGCCVLLTENEQAAIIIRVPQSYERSIQEPKDEQVIKGPHDGFIENPVTNLYLLRKRLRNPKLKVKYFTMGKLTNTKVTMVYMDQIALPKLVAEAEKRLSSVDSDYLYSVGNINELLEEHPMSLFPQTLQTERPDRAVSYLMEGKIIIFVAGNPRALILPITFFAFYQSPDDYNTRWIIGSFYRIIRLISFVIAICLPAIYIAIVTYHSEVLPIGILYSVKVSLTYVPLPPLLEALVMQTILELLKEAAIRLPSPISQTIGIVGGLVIGTAVVEAQLVSHTMIVVIGLTAIASFATPINEFGTSLRVLGFPIMLAASAFGFFGIAIMLMLVFIHLCKIETLGIPYFAPFGPFEGKESIKDIFLRLPLWMVTRTSRDKGQGGTKHSLFGRWKRP
ncbi:spore germination protein [Paenibacillus montanisoli]|uniref:spore germination protein n=1 Tax=Paenibacillus montanisoli TaxID=2081970 RepID=UPI00140347F4|nr:spore germination protein [Paenibacillus montanisoli]